jgi:hypothetical protein
MFGDSKKDLMVLNAQKTTRGIENLADHSLEISV